MSLEDHRACGVQRYMQLCWKTTIRTNLSSQIFAMKTTHLINNKTYTVWITVNTSRKLWRSRCDAVQQQRWRAATTTMTTTCSRLWRQRLHVCLTIVTITTIHYQRTYSLVDPNRQTNKNDNTIMGRLVLSLCTHARVANSNKSCDMVINLKKNKIKWENCLKNNVVKRNDKKNQPKKTDIF